jgi:hypothetical protein
MWMYNVIFISDVPMTFPKVCYHVSEVAHGGMGASAILGVNACVLSLKEDGSRDRGRGNDRMLINIGRCS